MTCISAWVAVSLLLVLPLFIDASFGSSFDASSEWGFFSLVCGIVIAGAAAAVSFGARACNCFGRARRRTELVGPIRHANPGRWVPILEPEIDTERPGFACDTERPGFACDTERPGFACDTERPGFACVPL